MYTTVAYSVNQDEGGAYKTLTPVADQSARVEGDNIYIGLLNKLAGIYVAGGANAAAAYVDTPSLRRLALYDVPTVQLAINPTDDEAVRLFPYNPISLMTNEGMKVYLKATPGATEQHTAIVFLEDAPAVPVGGEFFTVQASAAAAGVVGSWVYSELTFRQNLPVGKYAVVGAKGILDGMVAFRFVPVGAAYRPGGIASANVSQKEADLQRIGRLGKWFEFDSTTPPGIEFLVASAASNPTFYIDLMKVA